MPSINRRQFLCKLARGVAGLIAAGYSLSQAWARQDQPNIIFILIDDLGYKDLSCYGSTFYETPNIDRLARNGMLFTDGYAACPVCSPTRASILTGKYPARLNQTDWIPGRGNLRDQKLLQVEDLNHLPREELTIAEVLQKAGYANGHIGKWHLGGEGYLPQDQGFDVNIAGNRRGSPPSYFYPYKRGEDWQLAGLAETGEEGEYLTDRLGREAAQFIHEHKATPFFLYFANYAVHIPLQSKWELTEKYRTKAASLSDKDSWIFGAEGLHPVRQVQNHPIYAGMVESMDDSVGAILDAVEQEGLKNDTVIFFFSDNGGLSTSEGWPTSNLPLRGGKGWLYEGGIREPMIVTWPGVIEPDSRCTAPVSSVDFFPTIMDITGAEVPSGQTIDGVSLLPLLQQTGDLDRKAIYWHYPHYSKQGGGQGGAIRLGDYKLIRYYEDDRIELYNLRTDVGEQHNLASIRPEKAALLAEKLNQWLSSVDARMPEPNPDYIPPEGYRN